MTGTLTANDVQDDPILSLPNFRRRVQTLNAPTAIVGDAKRQDEFARLIAEAASYSKLKTNWDFDAGLPADFRAVRFVTFLLQRLQACPEIPAPTLRPITTGAFLSWEMCDRELYFEVDAESVLAVERHGGKSVFSAEDRQFNAEAAALRVVQFFE